MRKSPSPVLAKEIMKLDAFKDKKQHIVSAASTEYQMTVSYLKDVSTMLAIASAVREDSLKRYSSAEHEILKLMVAFDHINYAGYIAYWQVYLNNLLRKHNSIVSDLITNGDGASCSKAVARKCSVKKVFLEISQSSQENKF